MFYPISLWFVFFFCNSVTAISQVLSVRKYTDVEPHQPAASTLVFMQRLQSHAPEEGETKTSRHFSQICFCSSPSRDWFWVLTCETKYCCFTAIYVKLKKKAEGTIVKSFGLCSWVVLSLTRGHLTAPSLCPLGGFGLSQKKKGFHKGAAR